MILVFADEAQMVQVPASKSQANIGQEAQRHR
jgi:hypothetical protein